jgi:hypothetical protein
MMPRQHHYQYLSLFSGFGKNKLGTRRENKVFTESEPFFCNRVAMADSGVAADSKLNMLVTAQHSSGFHQALIG